MVKIILPEADDDVFDQCDFESFRASGKGGQHVNKTESAVRLFHRSSGITVTSQESRSQWRNRMICLRKLREEVAILNRVVKPRISTSKPRSAKRVSRKAKSLHSRKKQNRSGQEWIDSDD